jgi:hypothetical protein
MLTENVCRNLSAWFATPVWFDQCCQNEELTEEIAPHANCEQSAVAEREERRGPLYQQR